MECLQKIIKEKTNDECDVLDLILEIKEISPHLNPNEYPALNAVYEVATEGTARCLANVFREETDENP